MAETFTPVPTAIIGCGTIGGVHAENYAATPKARLAAVCDLLPDKAGELGAKYGAKPYADYRELLRDPAIEAVSVCLPNDLHHPVTLEALRAGKHVLCEKPIGLDLAQAKEMRDTAKACGRQLLIGVVNRFNGYVNLLRDTIARGDLGQIYHVMIMFKSYRSIPGLGSWFTEKARAGGGVMIDWGVHFVDLVLYCLGFPRPTTMSGQAHARLAADMRRYHYLSMWAREPDYDGVSDVEEYASGFFRTEGGPSISFDGAWAQNVGENQMYIEFLGDRGGARLKYGDAFTLWHDGPDGALYKTEAALRAPPMFLQEIEEFCLRAREGGTSRADIGTVLATQAVLDAFYRSSAEGREVAVETV